MREFLILLSTLKVWIPATYYKIKRTSLNKVNKMKEECQNCQIYILEQLSLLLSKVEGLEQNLVQVISTLLPLNQRAKSWNKQGQLWLIVLISA